jgi:hypothetical protein
MTLEIPTGLDRDLSRTPSWLETRRIAAGPSVT